MSDDRRRRKARPADGPDRDDRRQELLDAAVRAIRNDGQDVSMDAIAREAGITKPILYSHFGDKAGLAEALSLQFSSSLVGLLERAVDRTKAPRDTVSDMIGAYVELIDSEPNLYRFLVDGWSGKPGQQQLVDDLGATVARELGERLRSAGADSGGAEPWAYGIVGMVDMAASWWLDRKTMSRADLVEYMTKLLWDGLSSSGIA